MRAARGTNPSLRPMLTYLIIRDFAIIDSLELELSDGFWVLTGETGAGKSIIINALNLVLGGRASVDVVRADASRAVVEATFVLEGERRKVLDKLLESQGIEVREELMIRRVVYKHGRSRAFVNDSLVGLSNLKAITEGLVDISGQHEHYSLMSSENHIDILDRFGELPDLAESVQASIGRLANLAREVRTLKRTERERLARMDFLKFQLDEIDRALLDPESLAQMEREIELLRHAERLREETYEIKYMLYDSEQSVSDVMGNACAALARLVSIDPRLENISNMLEEALVQFDEAAVELRSYANDIEVNPARLEQIQEWLHAYKTLERKYGDDFDAIVEKQADMRAEYRKLKGAENRIEEAEAMRLELQKEAMAQARTLSARRQEAARWLKESIESELAPLNMERCRFETRITHKDGSGNPVELEAAGPDALNEKGLDHVEFLIAPNPGEGLKPLARIASGGELSRIMLAIKNALMSTDPVETYIFDEVDTGIGGLVADSIGAKIKKVSRSKQVLCITHLPQIAAYGDHHLQVEKLQGTDRTTSHVMLLDSERRVREIARMLGGRDCTPTTLAHAAEMIRSRI